MIVTAGAGGCMASGARFFCAPPRPPQMLLSCADAPRPLSQPPALGRSSLSRLPPGAPLRSAPRLPCLRPLRGFRRSPPDVEADAPGEHPYGLIWRGADIPELSELSDLSEGRRKPPEGCGACVIPGSERPHRRCARGDRGQSRPHPFAASPCGREAAQEQPRRVRRSPGEDRRHRNFRMESEICIFQEKAVTLPMKTHTHACAPGGERPAKQIGADRF